MAKLIQAKFKFKNTAYIYNTIIMGGLLALFSFGVFFWDSNPLNVENVSAVMEASTQFDNIKATNYLDSIKKLVESDNAREAIDKVASFEKAIAVLNSSKIGDSDYDNLNGQLLKLKQSINNIIAFTDFSTIVKVLTARMLEFENYVINNQWKTLTRGATRITSRMVLEKSKVSGVYDFSKMDTANNKNISDLDYMKNVTISSVLTPQNKSTIVAKLDSLNVEFMMLKKYFAGIKNFDTHFNNFQSTYSAWLADVGPRLSFRKLQTEKHGELILYIFIGICALIGLALLIGYPINQKVIACNKKQVEDLIIQAIKEGIIPSDSKFEMGFSKIFCEKLAKFHDYVQNRMSFGSVFQEANPFSSILLDSNLNVIWSNQLFHENWKIERKSDQDGFLTWDYLQQFTNLGEDDPVIDALNNKIAGIYQIQLKTDEDQVQPYEMYVSPVEYAGKTRIMIFFYPLCFIQETIANQTKSLIGPISRTLDAFSHEQYTNEFASKVAKDYKAAGIDELFDKFQMHYRLISNEKLDLLKHIDGLENDLANHRKMINDIGSVVVDSKENHKKIMNILLAAKEAVVSEVELRKDVEELYRDTILRVKELASVETSLASDALDLDRMIGENMNSLRSISEIKDEFKGIKNEIDDCKSTVIRQLNEVIVKGKSKGITTGEISKGLIDIKNECKKFELIVAKFNNVAMMLDVALSKVELQMQNVDLPEISDYLGTFESARNNLETDHSNLVQLITKGNRTDESVISSLKDLVMSFKDGKNLVDNISLIATVEKSAIDGSPEEIVETLFANQTEQEQIVSH